MLWYATGDTFIRLGCPGCREERPRGISTGSCKAGEGITGWLRSRQSLLRITRVLCVSEVL
jgi:hypothetical protein